MATPDNTTEDRLLTAVRQVLEGLKKTTDGAVLYSFIERGLRKRPCKRTTSSGRSRTPG